jgi:hypothetical protein
MIKLWFHYHLMRWFLMFELAFFSENFYRRRTLAHRNLFGTDYRVYQWDGIIKHGYFLNEWLRRTERALYGRAMGSAYRAGYNQIEVPRWWKIRERMKESS